MRLWLPEVKDVYERRWSTLSEMKTQRERLAGVDRRSSDQRGITRGWAQSWRLSLLSTLNIHLLPTDMAQMCLCGRELIMFNWAHWQTKPCQDEIASVTLGLSASCAERRVIEGLDSCTWSGRNSFLPVTASLHSVTPGERKKHIFHSFTFYSMYRI